MADQVSNHGCHRIPGWRPWCSCPGYVNAFWLEMEDIMTRHKKLFSERLRAIRTMRGLTQEDIATVLKVSSVAVCKYEAGESWPETDRLIALAEYFRIGVDEILGRAPLSVSSPPPKED